MPAVGSAAPVVAGPAVRARTRERVSRVRALACDCCCALLLLLRPSWARPSVQAPGHTCSGRRHACCCGSRRCARSTTCSAAAGWGFVYTSPPPHRTCCHAAPTRKSLSPFPARGSRQSAILRQCDLALKARPATLRPSARGRPPGARGTHCAASACRTTEVKRGSLPRRVPDRSRSHRKRLEPPPLPSPSRPRTLFSASQAPPSRSVSLGRWKKQEREKKPRKNGDGQGLEKARREQGALPAERHGRRRRDGDG